MRLFGSPSLSRRCPPRRTPASPHHTPAAPSRQLGQASWDYVAFEPLEYPREEDSHVYSVTTKEELLDWLKNGDQMYRDITRQAAYVQVVMAADPRVIALVDDSDKVYSKPLYVEPMVRERGKPHYAPEDLFMFAEGHANRHRVDKAVNELRDVSAKAELHRFRSYTQEAECVEQRLHHLALALGEIKGELSRSKFCLEMVDIVARIEEKQQGWMGGMGPTRRRGRRS
ncbi:hypothetical protein EDB85DRAFT_2141961 [Lactarius pseudohatsudake]|nr:hypothetical protein EDB85DRAFT_2141961 [Lactarius pseudohatsudake]